MKNRQNLLKVCFVILILQVLVFHRAAASDFPPTSTTNITICNNQLPYHWNGLTCLTAGSYSATLVAANGGDSIANLNLSVINVATSITNAIICDNELPYFWNGNSYTSNGTYSVTLTSSSGCDSVPILSLTVNHVVTSTTNRTICSNQLPYSWNGNNYPAAGSYVVTLTSAAGCDSIATLNLTVNAVSSGTTTAVVCISQLPYHWNGNTYPTAGTYTLTFANSNGCDSVATLNLSTNTSVTSNTFISVCSNQLPYAWNGNNYAAAGNYPVTLVSSSGCDSIATLHLTVKPIVTSNTNVTICNGQLPYSWNGNNYPIAGNYSVTLTGSSGCDSIANLHLVSVAFLTSNTNHSMCSSALPYTWNGNSYAAAGSYTASFVTTAGCDSIATLNLTVIAPSVGTDSLSVCEGDLPLTWHGYTFLTGGTYQITPPVNINSCYAVDSVVVTVQVVVPSTTAVNVCSNNLPYIWNGNNYTTSGMYGVLLTSSSGCDSLANLNLTVNPASTSTTTTSICSNQLPYNWNGNNFNSTGVYPVTLTSVNGCDSVATLNLTVNPVMSSTTDVTVCNSQLPYSWNGNNYSTNGTYSATLVSSGGCDSVATLHFVVLPFLTSTSNISICSNQLPYSWNGNSYSTAGVYPVNLTSSAGCDSVATLNLVINDVITSTTNINTCTNQIPYSWNGNTYSTSGTYTATLITSGGCDSVATLNLIVNPVLTSTTELTICTNQLPFSWNGNSYPVEGVYPVTLAGSNGCDSIATLNLIVTDILTSTTNVNICPAQLPYTWNGNIYSTDGTYSVTLSTAGGCDSVPILSLTVVPYVTSTTDLTICNNQLPYTWNGNTYAAAGTYSVLLTGASVCDSLATLNLSALPAIISNTAVSVCEDQLPYSWNGNDYSVAGNYSVTLTSSGGCDSIANLNLTVNAPVTSSTDISICEAQLPYTWNGNSFAIAGIYSVNLTSSAGCDSIATLNLTANPVVTSTTDLLICTNQLPYTWNGNVYPSAGTYSVTLTSSAGCDSIATLNLSANPVVTSTTNISTCETQLPYVWNGNNYNAAGSYSMNFTSSSGCDSVATLALVVNSTITSTTATAICNNEIPYLWNGQSYNSAGSYNVTLTSVAGCDSIATLNLTINQATNSSTSLSACENQLPFNWNGQSYSAAGVYSVVLTNSSGCDSTATLNLTVNTITTSITNINTCNNQLPYSWNGNNYNATGTYTVTLNSSAGCDSIVTLNLVVSNVVTSLTNDTTCQTQLPYIWNGNSYTTTGNYSATLTSIMGCDSIASLHLIVNPVTNSTTNVSTCNNQIPYTWNGNNYSSTGTYTVTLNNAVGCDSVATLHLTVVQITNSNTIINTCENDLPFTWNGQTYSTAGTHIVTLANAAGCDSIATLQLIVNPVTSSLSNVSICSADLPYLWNGHNYTAAGTFPINLTNASGCDSIATLNLTVHPTPVAPAANSPVTYCQYDQTTALTANTSVAGAQLLWYNNLTGGSGTTNAPIPSSLNPGVTNYFVSQADNFCEGPRVLVMVVINAKPELGPDQSLKICFGQTADFTSLFNTNGNAISWTYNQSPLVQPDSVGIAGNYQLIVQNNAGCTDTAHVNLAIQPEVIANAGNDADAEYNMPYQLTGSGGGTYNWSPANVLNNPFSAYPLATLTENTGFILTVSDDIGCFDRDTVNLRVLKGPTFYVPTAFTPNGDGLNDIFKPTPVGISSLEFFRVFNRYGELVYETHDIGQGWDGTYKGVKQSIGNYVWSLKGTDRTGKVKVLKGNCVLIR